MLACENCNGRNITTLAWVDANTNEYKSDGLSEEEDNWCEDCKKHINFIEYKIGNKKKNNKLNNK